MKKFLLISLQLLICVVPCVSASEQGNKLFFLIYGAKSDKPSKRQPSIGIFQDLAQQVPVFIDVIKKQHNGAIDFSYTFSEATADDLEVFGKYLQINHDESISDDAKKRLLSSLDFTQLGRLTVMANQAYTCGEEEFKHYISRHLIDAWKSKIDHKKEGEYNRVRGLLGNDENLINLVWERTHPVQELPKIEQSPKVERPKIEEVDEDDCFDFKDEIKVKPGSVPVPVPEDQVLVAEFLKSCKDGTPSMWGMTKILLAPYKNYIYVSLSVFTVCVAGLLYKIMHQNANA